MSLDPMFSTEQFAKGLSVRREVLGSEYVDKSVADVHPFMKPFQKMVTEWCWGEVWTLESFKTALEVIREDDVLAKQDGAAKNG